MSLLLSVDVLIVVFVFKYHLSIGDHDADYIGHGQRSWLCLVSLVMVIANIQCAFTDMQPWCLAHWSWSCRCRPLHLGGSSDPASAASPAKGINIVVHIISRSRSFWIHGAPPMLLMEVMGYKSTKTVYNGQLAILTGPFCQNKGQ